jgi:hypothetical protein
MLALTTAGTAEARGEPLTVMCFGAAPDHVRAKPLHRSGVQYRDLS